jgi:hypothetical protein
VITDIRWRLSRDAVATPYSEKGAVGYPMASQRRRLKSYPSRDNFRLLAGQKDLLHEATIGVITLTATRETRAHRRGQRKGAPWMEAVLRKRREQSKSVIHFKRQRLSGQLKSGELWLIK